MMLVLFFAALSETSEINLFMIKRISCTVDYRSAGPLLSFCSIEELLSLGTERICPWPKPYNGLVYDKKSGTLHLTGI